MSVLDNLKLKVSEKELNAIETLEDRIKELVSNIKIIKGSIQDLHDMENEERRKLGYADSLQVINEVLTPPTNTPKKK